MAEYRFNGKWVMAYTADNELVYGPVHYGYIYMKTPHIVFAGNSLSECHDKILELGLTKIHRLSPRLAYLASLNDSISGQDISFS
jgi:hypothetical protein